MDGWIHKWKGVDLEMDHCCRDRLIAVGVEEQWICICVMSVFLYLWMDWWKNKWMGDEWVVEGIY